MTTAIKIPSKQALLREIVSQEMAPDGKIDVERVLAIARSRVQQLYPQSGYTFTRPAVHSRASEVRKLRGQSLQKNKSLPTNTPFISTSPKPSANTTLVPENLEHLFAAKKLLKAFAFDLTKATTTLQAVHTLFDKEPTP